MLVVLSLLLCSVVAFALSASPVLAASISSNDHHGNSCQLDSAQGNIQHVIYIQFDNLHLTRDNPNVPSDLEQMPALLNFMEQNGIVMSDQQTPLISHTANDILTSLTGVYPDRLGEAVSNSYGYFNPSGTVSFASSFTYWTDKVGGTNSNYNLLTSTGQNAPAPWVSYTRAGCDVGAVGTANLELENLGGDITTVFGAGSPQAGEVTANYNQAYADFVGIAVHCATGNSVCSTSNGGVGDVLPNEPGGYNGYNALFGNKYVAPVINGGQPMTDLSGNVISDGAGHDGFPGFDGMSASVSLSYVAAMQEHGIPITYAYISDAHDNHTTGNAYGPGEAGYVAQLAAYNQAFATFFARLQHDGITSKNTLFVVTADENDHFVGGLPTPSNCDGVNIPCTYSQIGEVDADLTGLLSTTTQYSTHFDSAPAIYIKGNPSPSATVTRNLEGSVAALSVVNPISGATDQVTQYMADSVELNLLHMVTADPARTPTFIDFANPDYFITSGVNYCSVPTVYVCLDSGFAWNHGDVQPVITTTWLGLVGPGVAKNGLDTSTVSDHADIRPTMMALLGLRDDYTYDGHVIAQALDDGAIRSILHGSGELNSYDSLAAMYDQINAPTGQFALTTLTISTHALESHTPGDATYSYLEGQLTSMTTQRDAIASQMNAILQSAVFGSNNQHIDDTQADSLIAQGQRLLTQANTLAALLA
ncbi:MAG: hypothetical protein OK474_01175 [Thaumarchaeota archaeon]|nr:hypothetical protein [Nitrososphaerota archaeon]